uniref:Uncharacterized protein n=1 Tax=Amphimedon queenslandica TaxID=400682 RepID=A0A1X7TEB4_AMPQE
MERRRDLLTFEEFSKRNVHISSDYLLLLCNELCSQLESSGSIRRGGGGGHSLIGNEISSFIYNNNNYNNVSSSLLKLTNQKHDFTTDHLQKDSTLHLCKFISTMLVLN